MLYPWHLELIFSERIMTSFALKNRYKFLDVLKFDSFIDFIPLYFIQV